MSSKKRFVRILFAVILMMWAFGAGNVIAGKRDGQAVRQACKADYQTFCTGVQPGGGRIIACLQQNFEKLSPGCQDALTAARAARQAPRPAQ